MDDLHNLHIGKKRIGDDTDAYIIAEIGHNHCGDLAKAFDLIRKAKECGADAVKTQKRNNKKIFTKELFEAPYVNENSYGTTYGEHREALEFGRSDYQKLFDFAKTVGIDFFATAFDEDSADFLMEFNPPAFKISSGDLTNLPLLDHIAEFKKPIILSTGRATMQEIEAAIDVITAHHGKIAILQCTASYPCAFEELDLRVIETFRKHFPFCVGISSHDNGIAMGPVAYVLGARVIEKHFTLNHTWKGTDHAFSLEPNGFEKFVRDVRRVRTALGDGEKKMYSSEDKPILKMRKSIYAAKDLKQGQTLEFDDLALKSPAIGLSGIHFGMFLGRKVKRDIFQDSLLTYDDLEAIK